MRSVRVLFLVAVLASCGGGGDGDGVGMDDLHRPGLAFAVSPASIRLNGLFQIWVRINDANGQLQVLDSSTEVTLSAAGRGKLGGTLKRRAHQGTVLFDDLTYDAWERITFTAAAPGLPGVTMRAAIPVRPVMRFVQIPPARVAENVPFGPFRIEVVDGQGQRVPIQQTVRVSAAEGDLDVEGGAERDFAGGEATFPAIAVKRAGSQSLIWRSPELGDLIHGVTVHEGNDVDRVWLRAAREGLPYAVRLPGNPTGCQLLSGTLPKGLRLEGESCALLGVPTDAGHMTAELFGVRSTGVPVSWRVELTVFPSVESTAQPLDALAAPGPFEVGTLDDTITLMSTGLREKIRIFYPAQAGRVANGVFPLVVFHHGAAPYDPNHPRIFDRFDHLLTQWASHGFVVVTIDAFDLVFIRGRVSDATLGNMTLMSEGQRAAITTLRARNDDPTFALAGHIDTDRVVAAGMSRGGGASIITARTDPSVVAGILIKPLDPMATVGGAKVWNRPLPTRPFLMISGEGDADLPFPMVDFLYERRSAAMTSVTIGGAAHFSSCDGCALEPGAQLEIERSQEWAVTNAYTIAFLKYATRGDLGQAPLLFGRGGQSTALSPRGVLVQSDRGSDALLVDDFRDDAVGRNALGLPATNTGPLTAGEEPSILDAIRSLPSTYTFAKVLYSQPEIIAHTTANRLQWTDAGQGAVHGQDLGGADVEGRAAFVFRVRTPDAPVSAEQISLRFVDGNQRSMTAPIRPYLGASSIGRRFSDVIVPVADLAAAMLDLENLARVELVVAGSGQVVVDDFRFE